MNRAERRRLKRNQESCNATYTLRNEDVTRIKQDAAQEAIDKAFVLMLGLPMIVLHDKYGWGKKRLSDFTNHVLEQYDSFNKNFIALDDLWNTIEKETGVKLIEKVGRRCLGMRRLLCRCLDAVAGTAQRRIEHGIKRAYE